MNLSANDLPRERLKTYSRIVGGLIACIGATAFSLSMAGFYDFPPALSFFVALIGAIIYTPEEGLRQGDDREFGF